MILCIPSYSVFDPLYSKLHSVWSSVFHVAQCLILCIPCYSVFDPLYSMLLSVWSPVFHVTQCLILCILCCLPYIFPLICLGQSFYDILWTHNYKTTLQKLDTIATNYQTFRWMGSPHERTESLDGPLLTDKCWTSVNDKLEHVLYFR